VTVVLAKCRNDLGYAMVLNISSVDHFGDAGGDLRSSMKSRAGMIPDTCG
jgi:hypothetical protein